jgi:hypothetical protein
MVVRPTAVTPSIYRSPETEMIEPTVTPRIERRESNDGHNPARNRIDTGQVRAFPEIAAVAGKGQIAGIVGPTVLAGYDVLNVMRKRRTILRKEAIFTTWFGRVYASPTPSLHGVGKLPADL